MKRFFLFMLILVCAGTFISCDKDHEPMLLTEEVVEQEDLTKAIVGTYIGKSITTSEKDDLKQETTQVEVESIGKEKVNLTLKRHAEGVNREDVEEIAEVSVTLEEEEYKLSTIGITSGGVTFTVNGAVNGKDIKIKIIYDRPDNKTISEITGVHK